MAKRLEVAAVARRVISPPARADDAPPMPTTPTAERALAEANPRSGVGPAPSTPLPAPTSYRPRRPEPDVTRSADAEPRVVIGTIEVVTAPPRPTRPDPLAVLAERRRGRRHQRSGGRR
jgi:hypothetical protein